MAARTLLTDFELMVLLAVLRVGEQAYGAAIAREIESTAGRTVMLGALYAALERMEAGGLVTSELGAPTRERGGRAKRLFTVSGGGIRAIKDTQRALVALWSGVPALKRGGI